MFQTLTSAPTRCRRHTAVPSCRHAATVGRAVSGSWIDIQAVFCVTESGNTLQLAPCVAVSLKNMSTRVLNRPLGCKSNLSGVVFNWQQQSVQLRLPCQMFSFFFFLFFFHQWEEVDCLTDASRSVTPVQAVKCFCLFPKGMDSSQRSHILQNSLHVFFNSGLYLHYCQWTPQKWENSIICLKASVLAGS